MSPAQVFYPIVGSTYRCHGESRVFTARVTACDKDTVTVKIHEGQDYLDENGKRLMYTSAPVVLQRMATRFEEWL